MKQDPPIKEYESTTTRVDATLKDAPSPYRPPGHGWRLVATNIYTYGGARGRTFIWTWERQKPAECRAGVGLAGYTDKVITAKPKASKELVTRCANHARRVIRILSGWDPNDVKHPDLVAKALERDVRLVLDKGYTAGALHNAWRARREAFLLKNPNQPGYAWDNPTLLPFARIPREDQNAFIVFVAAVKEEASRHPGGAPKLPLQSVNLTQQTNDILTTRIRAALRQLEKERAFMARSSYQALRKALA